MGKIWTFEEDDRWQRERINEIVVPLFYKKRFKHFEPIDPKDPRSAGGTDTIVTTWKDELQRVDDKMVRWPEERGYPYDAFLLETHSCTIPGRERDGWMKTNTVPRLQYSMCNKDETGVLLYWIDFPPLQQWFWENADTAPWPDWTGEQFLNRPKGRVVWIRDVRKITQIYEAELVFDPDHRDTPTHRHPYGCLARRVWQRLDPPMKGLWWKETENCAFPGHASPDLIQVLRRLEKQDAP